MTRQVPHKRIIDALTNRFGGEINAVGRDDVVMKLASALGERTSGGVLLYARLKEMADLGKVTLEYSDRRISRIALPTDEQQAAQNEAPSQDSQEDLDMGAPRRRHATSSPRDSQGAELPSFLRDDQVGELEVRYADPQIEGEIAATADLVVEGLRAYTRKTIKRSEMIAAIETLLGELGHTTAAATSLSIQVLGYMLRSSWLTQPKKLEKDTVYTLTLPAIEQVSAEATEPELVDPSQMKPREAIIALVKKVEELKEALRTAQEQHREQREANSGLEANIAELQRQLEAAKAEAAAKPKVDAEVVRQLAARVEALKVKVAEQDTAAATASTRHNAELQRLKTANSRALMDASETHEAEKKKLETELQRAKDDVARLRKELETATAALKKVNLDDDLTSVVNAALS